MRFHREDARRWERAGRPPRLELADASLGLALRGLVPPATCRAWCAAVRRARGAWSRDFGGQQFALGRAFYTHLESARADAYFRDRAASDARVEQALPGMQAWAREIYGALAGGRARQRLGFAGAAVHVFPKGAQVAREGGVVHFDVEGLSPVHVAARARAMSLVVMLQPADWGGGLRVWDARFEGSEAPSERQVAAIAATLRYRAGDALFFSSYRLHQIRPFRGGRDRVSITLHGVEVDRGVWDTWF